MLKLESNLWLRLIALLICQIFSTTELRAEQIWIHELNELDQDGVIVSFKMRYLVNDPHIYYEISIVNQTGKNIYLPPLKNEEKSNHLGVEPYYDIYLKFDGEWQQWIQNRQIKDKWNMHESTLAYKNMFSGSLNIGNDFGRVDRNDGLMLHTIPSIPEGIKLIFPYKTGNTERISTYTLTQRSINEYACLLLEKGDECIAPLQ